MFTSPIDSGSEEEDMTSGLGLLESVGNSWVRNEQEQLLWYVSVAGAQITTNSVETTWWFFNKRFCW